MVTQSERGGEAKNGMALVCKNGAKECCGCGECLENDRIAELECHFCGKRLDEDEGYRDLLFAVLCLECLMKLHRL